VTQTHGTPARTHVVTPTENSHSIIQLKNRDKSYRDLPCVIAITAPACCSRCLSIKAPASFSRRQLHGHAVIQRRSVSARSASSYTKHCCFTDIQRRCAHPPPKSTTWCSSHESMTLMQCMYHTCVHMPRHLLQMLRCCCRARKKPFRPGSSFQCKSMLANNCAWGLLAKRQAEGCVGVVRDPRAVGYSTCTTSTAAQ
jgi:hypothetical protein